MHYTLIFSISLFLITLAGISVYHNFPKISPKEKQQLTDKKRRHTILQRQVERMIEIEKKHLKHLHEIYQKIADLEQEIAGQKKVKDK